MRLAHGGQSGEVAAGGRSFRFSPTRQWLHPKSLSPPSPSSPSPSSKWGGRLLQGLRNNLLPPNQGRGGREGPEMQAGKAGLRERQTGREKNLRKQQPRNRPRQDLNGFKHANQLEKGNFIPR